MVKFSDSFWSHDYASGIDVLFEKLHDGCQENQDYINLFSSRQQSELGFGNSLLAVPERSNGQPKQGLGLNTTIKNSFVGINSQIVKEAEFHLEISRNIENHVVLPFTNWAVKHKQRVAFSETELKNKIKAHDKLSSAVDRSRVKYFNKVRSAEEFKEKLDDKITETLQKANSLTDADAVIDPKAASTLKRSNTTIVDDMQTLAVDKDSAPPVAEEEEHTVILGGDEYNDSQLKDILSTLLNLVPKFDHKVPIFGTYERVSTGSSIVEAIQKNFGISKLDKSEQFGQDLIANGYLRLIGTVGSQFANSSKLNYQWKPEAYKAADIPLEASLSASSTFYNPVNELNPGIKFSEVFDDVKVLITTMEPNEENYKKILKDVKKYEMEYFENAKLLDALRMELEENIEEHLNFMQRCELDRLKALKKVTLDFLSILANKFGSLKSVVEKSMEFQDKMNPENDLLQMIETHKTGSFIPHLKIFEDYFDSNDTQVFGVSLQSRCKFDHKSVPLIISQILIHLDETYPGMKDDDERISVWLQDVPLVKTHELRNILNDPKLEINKELLIKFSPPVLASVLMLYLLELPNSLVPNEKYFLMKSLYDQYSGLENAKERIVGVENLLVDLPRPNIATLSYLCAHLSNFISIIALNDDKDKKTDGTLPKSEYFKIKVCRKYATAILRPKAQYAISLTDKHSFSLLMDLLTHKDEIFKELKKRNTTLKKSSVSRNTSKKSQPALRSASGAGSVPSSTESTTLKKVDPEPLVLSVDNKESTASAPDGESLARKRSNDEEPDTVLKF